MKFFSDVVKLDWPSFVQSEQYSLSGEGIANLGIGKEHVSSSKAERHIEERMIGDSLFIIIFEFFNWLKISGVNFRGTSPDPRGSGRTAQRLGV